MIAKTYLRRPDSVYAAQYTKYSSAEEFTKFVGKDWIEDGKDRLSIYRGGREIVARSGDWIVKNSKGDIFVVPDEIFEQVYLEMKN